MGLAIRGLIKFTKEVRSRLGNGLDAGEYARLVQAIQNTIARVEDICASYNQTPQALPAPSRRAYEYLCSLDLDKLGNTAISATSTASTSTASTSSTPGAAKKIGKARESGAAKTVYTVRGLLPALRSFLNQLAEANTPDRLATFEEDARGYLETTESFLKKQGAGRENLSLKQQGQLARLALYLKEPWKSRIPVNSSIFSEYLEEAWPRGLLFAGLPGIVYEPSDRRLWRLTNPKKSDALLKISDLFLLGEEPGLLKLLAQELCSRQSGRKRRASLRAALSEGAPDSFRKAIAEKLVHNEQGGAGIAHDLQLYFDEINAAFFDSTLEVHALYWTDNQARCRTGYYDPVSRTIYISQALDHQDVPEFVVRYVLYHEMLHLEQDDTGQLKPGKRIHTKEFHRREAAFPRHQEAETFLHQLAQKS